MDDKHAFLASYPADGGDYILYQFDYSGTCTALAKIDFDDAFSAAFEGKPVIQDDKISLPRTVTKEPAVSTAEPLISKFPSIRPIREAPILFMKPRSNITIRKIRMKHRRTRKFPKRFPIMKFPMLRTEAVLPEFYSISMNCRKDTSL